MCEVEAGKGRSLMASNARKSAPTLTRFNLPAFLYSTPSPSSTPILAGTTSWMHLKNQPTLQKPMLEIELHLC
jgi:hypothetical protein